MTDMDILTEMLMDSALIPIENEYGKPMVKLEEAGVKGAKVHPKYASRYYCY